MNHESLSRREMLLKCAALGSLIIPPSLASSEWLAIWAQERGGGKATTWDELGPFYKREAPLNARLHSAGEPGLPLTVAGRVVNTRGEILRDAKIEVWQADHLGKYDLDGYRYRSTLSVDSAGKYTFDSVIPGHYPGRVCQHIHYLVRAAGQKELVTQLYFATDPVFEGDPENNYKRDPLIQGRDLVRPVTLTGDPKDIRAAVTFEIVMERL